MSRRRTSLGFLGRFSAPKGNIELKFDKTTYTYTDKLSGLVIFDPLEDFALDELRLELEGHGKVSWRKGFSGYGSSGSLGTIKISLTGPMNVQKGQHFEYPFQVDIPLHAKSDPFTETELKAKAVVGIKDRPDIKHELPVAITFPYVIECLKNYGGCGFISPPSDVAIKTCPNCGSNLEEQWDKKYKALHGASSRRHGGYYRRH